MIKLIRKMLDDARFRYLVGGGWNTVFGYGIFFLLHTATGGKLHYEIIIVLSNIFAITNAYLVQKIFVFRKKGGAFHDFLKFSLVYVVLMMVNMVLAPVLIESWKLHVLLSQAIINVLIIVVGYIMNRYFTFKEKNVSVPEKVD